MILALGFIQQGPTQSPPFVMLFYSYTWIYNEVLWLWTWQLIAHFSINAIFMWILTFILISRFLLKSLLQYQSLSEGEILPTPSSSHPPVPPVALTSGAAGASGLSGGHNLTSAVSTGEEGPLKKPKKERKERGRENGKEDCECDLTLMRLNILHSTLANHFIALCFIQCQRRCLRRGSSQMGLESWCSPSLWTHLVVPSFLLYWEV